MSETSGNPYATDEPGKVLAPSQGCSQKLVLITVCVAIGFLLIGLMLPAVRTARPAARRMQCSNNMKQIGLAVANYEAAYRQLPPAYTIDPNGKPLHSWRTLILPYLEQAELYAKVDLTKPWDDPANDEVRSASIGVYQCPEGKIPPGHTTYLAVITENSCLRPGTGRRMPEIRDGKANTLLTYESKPSESVHWMSPQDADLEMFLSMGTKSTSHYGGCKSVFLDGSVRFLSNESATHDLVAMVTIDGGELFSSEQ